jgi:hypothetical protein
MAQGANTPMSTPQRNRTLMIAVDPSVGDVLRTQTLLVLEFTHHLYEDISSFCPEAQYALSVIFRDAFAVIDAVGWQRPDEPPERVEVPLTAGHVEQLRRRRYDLAMTNIDRLPDDNGPISPETLEEITADRLAAGALDRLMGRFYARYAPKEETA